MTDRFLRLIMTLLFYNNLITVTFLSQPINKMNKITNNYFLRHLNNMPDVPDIPGVSGLIKIFTLLSVFIWDLGIYNYVLSQRLVISKKIRILHWKYIGAGK